MSLLKSVIVKLPGGARLAEAVSYKIRSRRLAQIGNTEDRFTHIFEKNKWKDSESCSGAGSSLAATGAIRQALPRLLEELEVATLLDAPCGDYNWFQHIDLGPQVHYIGSDIVKGIVDTNREQFADDTTSFVHADISTDALPDADLWLCRDCLIHLSYVSIQRTLENFQRSNIRYWLTSTHASVDRNIDIPTGHCRMINLEIEPFSFPPPLCYIEDDDPEGTGKCLALWQRSQLADLRLQI
jgi:hypothetical protein